MSRIVIETPIEPTCNLAVTYEGEYVLEVDLAPQAQPFSNEDSFAIEIERQFRDYFSGDLKKGEFTLPFKFPAAKEFQRRAWEQIHKIPYGDTREYNEIADDINKISTDIELSPSDVACACRTNLLLLIVPCHRVVHATYPPGGWLGRKKDARCMCRKQRLIEHEEEHK